jgi:hypothetical protein
VVLAGEQVGCLRVARPERDRCSLHCRVEAKAPLGQTEEALVEGASTVGCAGADGELGTLNYFIYTRCITK